MKRIPHGRAWKVLNRDRADVFIDALIDINLYLNSHGGNPDLYQTQVLWKDKSYVAFSDTPFSRQLIRIYDREIKELAASGELEGIYRRWGRLYEPEYWAGD